MKGMLAEFDRCQPKNSVLPAAWQGPLQRHAAAGDRRLQQLTFHLSPTAHDLWNFLLTEEERLHAARRQGQFLVGAMKDLGTIPILVNALPQATAFYPDGAWWLPCFKARQTRLLAVADTQGATEGFCPVRAMLGAFALQCHFPMPDLLTCSTGATCDDFKALAQRLVECGHAIEYWEMPHMRTAEPGEAACTLASGHRVPAVLVDVIEAELGRLWQELRQRADAVCAQNALQQAIARSNRIRDLLRTILGSGLPALEQLICAMMALHYCSDYAMCEAVLTRVAAEAAATPQTQQGVPLYWINPVADVRVMNVLEEVGGRLAGSDFMFAHALDRLDETLPPLRALACMAADDPMAGPVEVRMRRAVADAHRVGAKGIVVSRIPGASHCPYESVCIKQLSDLPVVEIEVDSLVDAYAPSLTTRLQAFVETCAS